jgi:hypothetical protein
MLDFDSYRQCKGSHGKGNPTEIGCFLIQTHAAAGRIARILHHPTFFGWLKTQLGWREYNREYELHESVDEILTGLSIEMMETAFVDWMNRLQRLIDGNGDCVS